MKQINLNENNYTLEDLYNDIENVEKIIKEFKEDNNLINDVNDFMDLINEYIN